MSFKVIVFDFDGTLIDSNQLKYDTFFKLFPQESRYTDIVRDVLLQYLEESRYVILRKILEGLEPKKASVEKDIEALAVKYNALVLSGAKTCCEKPGATKILEDLNKRYRLFLFSVTPEDALKEIVTHRKWTSYFCGIFGYPKEKPLVLLELISREHVQPHEVLAVGDSASDRGAARLARCRFFSACADRALEKLNHLLINNKKAMVFRT